MATLAGQFGPVGYEYPNGQHAAGAQFRVTTLLGINITLYTDKNKTQTRPNPSTADGLGNISFYANPGEYLLRVNEGSPIGITVPLHPEEPLEGGGGGPGGPVAREWPIAIPTGVVDIPHNLGFDPAGIVCIRSGGTGQRVYPRVTYTDPDTTVRLNFPSAFAGTVFLS